MAYLKNWPVIGIVNAQKKGKMAKKYLKLIFISLKIREVQIQTLKFHFTPVRWQTSMEQLTAKAREDEWERLCSLPVYLSQTKKKNENNLSYNQPTDNENAVFIYYRKLFTFKGKRNHGPCRY